MLSGIADEPYDRAVSPSVREEARKTSGPSRRGFVDEHHRARAEYGCRIGVRVEHGEPVLECLGPDPGAAAESLGGASLVGGADDLVAGFLPCVARGVERERLA